MAAHQAPWLPAEIHRLVIHCFTSSRENLVFLWKDCRLVSKFFKHEAEAFLLSKHLPRFHLSLGFVDRRDSYENFPFQGILPCAIYEGMSKDQKKAIFKLEARDEAKRSQEKDQLIYSQRVYNMTIGTGSFKYAINPGLVLDERGDLEINWMVFFTVIVARREFHLQSVSWRFVGPTSRHPKRGNLR